MKRVISPGPAMLQRTAHEIKLQRVSVWIIKFRTPASNPTETFFFAMIAKLKLINRAMHQT
jgi:hypothetical protein